MQYKTVIFDMDGTILDTLEDIYLSCNYALAMHKLPKRTLDEVRMFVGNGIHKLVERAVAPGTDEATIEAVFTTLHSHYKVHSADHTKPYDGILDLMKTLRANGHQVAIVSNKANYAVKDLEKKYFPGLIDASCGESEHIERKPAPDMVFAIMQELHADPKSTIYIGDSDVDVETAKNAGIPCIGVNWGFRGREFLLACGADEKMLVDHPSEVLKLV